MARFPNAAFCRGIGPKESDYLLVGESPGKKENSVRFPFVGPTGQHLNMYFQRCGLPSRNEWRIENLVRYWPGPEPAKVEIQDVIRDEKALIDAIIECRPRYIVPTGGWSTRWFLGDVADMDKVHGIPHRVPEGSYEKTTSRAADAASRLRALERVLSRAVVTPVYHPASTLHNPLFSPKCFEDFQQVGLVVRGKIKPWEPTKQEKRYWERKDRDHHTFLKLALDTEFDPDGNPYCYSASDRYGEGWVCYYDPNDKGFNHRVAAARFVLHHALADLPPLRKMGITIPDDRLDDTREKAYLLETLPQGLKALAYRLLNLEMTDFIDVVKPYSMKRALKYLRLVESIEWPKPEPRLVLDKGKYREKNPQPIEKRVARMLGDYEKKPDKVDLWKRWSNLEQEETDLVEDQLGFPFPLVNVKDAPKEIVTQYASEDSSATIGVDDKLTMMIRAKGLEDIYKTDMAVIPLADRMMQNGWLLDLEYLDRLGEEFQEKIDDLAHQLSEFNGGKPINPRSADQVRVLLYKKLRLKADKKTKSGKDSTGKKQLQKLAPKAPKAIGLINQYREVSKLKTDYCVKGKTWVDKDGRVRTTIQPFTAVSGRWTTRDPAIQNIPVRTAEGLRIRKAFIAKPGCHIQLEDLDQIEMRVMATMSGDKNLIRLFVQGRDIHSENASLLFGVPLEKVDKVKHRYPAKQAGFGILYGIQGVGLLDQMFLRGIYDYDEDDMDRLIREWLKLYPGVKAYIRAVREKVLRDGYVQCLGGRRRTLPNVWSPVEWVREEALRQAVSHTISASAQWVMKRAMERVWRWLKEDVWPRKIYCEPLLQIHDELDYEVEVGFLEEAAKAKVQLMCNDPLLTRGAMKFKVPIKAKSASGPTWAECEK
jgi:uracil-DNA glycosylase family 4